MEILPGVHAVQLVGSVGYLIVEDRLTLIDAGFTGSHLPLALYLRRIGRSLGEIATVICTHSHADHVGGVRGIVGGRSVDVLMHPADAAQSDATLRDVFRHSTPSRLAGLLVRRPRNPGPLHDGELLPMMGGLEVMHTPGHTPGTICLYARAHRVLFVGDALQVISGKLSGPSHVFSADRGLALRSTARLADLDVEAIFFAHYAPWRQEPRLALRELAERT
jgi:glyoxylase-like metal-dependent hydrolase (beta-lactamase superfamily II)